MGRAEWRVAAGLRAYGTWTRLVRRGHRSPRLPERPQELTEWAPPSQGQARTILRGGPGKVRLQGKAYGLTTSCSRLMALGQRVTKPHAGASGLLGRLGKPKKLTFPQFCLDEPLVALEWMGAR
jgi:hypothetical protein